MHGLEAGPALPLPAPRRARVGENSLDADAAGELRAGGVVADGPSHLGRCVRKWMGTIDDPVVVVAAAVIAGTGGAGTRATAGGRARAARFVTCCVAGPAGCSGAPGGGAGGGSVFRF